MHKLTKDDVAAMLTALRATTKRFKALQAAARRRGCELHEATSDRVYDPETKEVEIVYGLFVLDYKDPVEFDDLDEVEFDIYSRSVVAKAKPSPVRDLIAEQLA